MRRASTQTYAFIATVVGLIIVFGTLTTVFQSNATATLTASTGRSSNQSTPQRSGVNSTATSSSPTLLESCLLRVEPPANVTLQTSQSIPGALVTYAPGQQVFYPQDSCPQPVSNKTYEYGANFPDAVVWVPTSNYRLALAAVTNPKFVSLADGTTYFYSQPGSSPFSSGSGDQLDKGPLNDTYGYTFPLVFYHYSDVINKCFGRLSFNATAGIEVDFFAPFPQQVNATRPIGSWNVTDPLVHALSAGQIQIEDLCSST